MSHPWITLAGIAAVGALYVLLPVVATVFLRFRAPRRLQCPKTRMSAEVGVDSAYAAWTAAFRNPIVRVKRCSLWPQRAGCGQECRTAPEIAAPEQAAPTAT